MRGCYLNNRLEVCSAMISRSKQSYPCGLQYSTRKMTVGSHDGRYANTTMHKPTTTASSVEMQSGVVASRAKMAEVRGAQASNQRLAPPSVMQQLIG